MDSLKSVAFLLLLTCLQPSGSIYCQSRDPTATSSNPTVTLSEVNSPLEKILREIHRQTGYTYFGVSSWTRKARRVTISARNAPVLQLLDSCFAGQPLYYTVIGGNSISILDKKEGWVVLRGRITNEKSEVVPGATIMTAGNQSRAGRVNPTSSFDNGEFVIQVPASDTGLVVSSVSYETLHIRIDGKRYFPLRLTASVTQLDIAVVATNGYQKIPKDRVTGSFNTVEEQLIERRVSPNILDRIDGVTSGTLFNKNPVPGTNQSTIAIRGRSTIFGSPDPLVVIDNFPYSGDINNLNPEDVESITILKDAAAASIWGAFSGNGVIVITTKKGKYNQAPKWSFNTSATIGNQPDLYYKPILSSSDYIDVEEMLFNDSFYSSKVNNLLHPALSPVVEILLKKQSGQLSGADAERQIDLLRGQDSRRDLDRYFYRNSLNTQYSLNLNGGGNRNRYFLSAGYDRNRSNLVRNGYQRVTLNGNSTYNLIPKRLEFSTGFTFTASNTQNNNNGFPILPYPYLKMAGNDGKALSVPAYYRQSFIDTVGGGQLQDWNYRPLDELRNANSTNHLQDYRLNLGIQYTMGKGFGLEIHYQYGHGSTDLLNVHSPDTYFTRDLVNSFSYLDSAGKVQRPIQVGGIRDESLITFDANNIRAQLNFDRRFDEDHAITAIAGSELRDVEMRTVTSRVYGYDGSRENGVPVNYSQNYPQYLSGELDKIPYIDHRLLNSDRYLSYFTNAAYTYKERYILSVSARWDESNLFGVDANKRGVPLWSAGLGWDLGREDFYKIDWLPNLKLRVTDGYNGNVDRSASAYTTTVVNPGFNPYGATTQSINNPPNPGLRWERINIFNAGVDFGMKKDRLGGSLEYYIKSGRDLIGQVPIDPTTGNTVFTGNTANMKANGFDLTLHGKNTMGPVRWNSYLLFSFVRDKVTNYGVPQGVISNYLNSAIVSPVIGKPLYSIYALHWAGLDGTNGDPQGLFDGHISKNYGAITNSNNLGDLVYKGPANPPFFGSFRNEFFWKQFGISINIVYKMGQYFRRNSIAYNALFVGNSPGHPDYRKRWQKPGDEQHTSVPSLDYPADQTRDDFYSYSEVLVEKGDHIRWQDLQLNYNLSKKSLNGLPVQEMHFYLYANNLGIIWRANHRGIDPDYVLSIPNPRTIALGVKMEF